MERSRSKVSRISTGVPLSSNAPALMSLILPRRGSERLHHQLAHAEEAIDHQPVAAVVVAHHHHRQFGARQARIVAAEHLHRGNQPDLAAVAIEVLAALEHLDRGARQAGGVDDEASGKA
jgi:hypothetical protein